MSKKNKGYDGEKFANDHYISQGYQLLQNNYTIRGGEIDLIFQKNNAITFVEVKVVDNIDDIFDYITKSKLSTLKKTIENYVYQNNINIPYTLDVVFVKNSQIYEIYENVTI